MVFPIGLDSLTLLLTNCSEANITTVTYFSHTFLSGIADYFNYLGTHFVNTLDISDYNNTLPLSTTTQSLCANVHNASILCGTQVYFCLRNEWSETCAMVFLF